MPGRMVLLLWFILSRRMGSWDIYLPSPGPVGYRWHVPLWGCASSQAVASEKALKHWSWDSLGAPEIGYRQCAFVVQLPSPVWLFLTPWTVERQASLSFIISQSLLELISIESVIPVHHFIPCSPLLLLPSIFPSIWVFSYESALHIRWPKLQHQSFQWIFRTGFL